MDIFDDMLKALENPAMRHAAVVHLPLALSTIGVPFVIVAAIASKRHWPRWTALLLYLVFAGAAWFALQTGEDAEALMKRNQPSQAFDLVHEHEEMGEKIWIFAAVVTALIAVSAFRKPLVRHGAAWVGVLAALFTAGWVAVTAHHGGSAVYLYAVGTANPMTFNEVGGGSRETASDGSDAQADTERPISLEGLDPKQVHFVTNVLPILESTCQRCHNPKRMRRSAQLDLTTQAAALHGGRSGAVIVGGKPDESLIMMRITSEDDEVRMPPDDPLTPEEIEAIRKWIAEGAVWVERN